MRFWRGARVVTRMTLNTLYTRSNSLLMCFGVSFHKQCFVPLTSSFEDSVHQLRWNSCPMETVCLSVKIDILCTNRAVAASCILSPLNPIMNDFFLSSDRLFIMPHLVFISGFL